MTSTVLRKGSANFDSSGRFLHNTMVDTDEQISAGLAARLIAYAITRAKSVGLYDMIRQWDFEVYTMDGDSKPADRYYNVRWTNKEGTSIELCAIMTNKGWPFLDHQFSMSEA